ncbi:MULTISPECIES: hypothetical protein [unclassified Caulobacter]|uniref:hypothetical protein n=1 Tax=unclassified Caulobacter TaxID=2648921 RepID=UPI000D36E44D|nr:MULTISPECIES: hypothetical protein [unclassified Caulobacter]PTS81938.1 hypothetical protein DBR21_17860 [Caulobacter sp. HMWF009]PTT11328.1 hypothetical protein DBR10_03860 [Caulobacter sp. HMWF025]
MSRPEDFEFLPPYLLELMKHRAVGVAWPVNAIPAVIEATRSAGRINLGGDLQVAGSEGVWESANQGLWVFPAELAQANAQAAEVAAEIALSKFLGLWNSGAFLDEAVAGCPDLAGQSFQAVLERLDFSWSIQTA